MKPVEETGRRLLPDAVADRIREAILDGEFAPGDRLPPERELAEQLHVNRSSIREALKKLEQLRLVEIQQGSGIRVRAVEDASFDLVWDLVARSGTRDRSWMLGLLELREALFPGIVRIAMNRSSPSELRKTSGKVHEFMQRAYSDAEFIDLLRTLQGDLAELTGNPVLKLFSNALQRGIDATPVARWLGPERRKITPLVLRVAVAVEAGDIDTAERTTRDITRRVNEAVIEGMNREASAHPHTDGS